MCWLQCQAFANGDESALTAEDKRKAWQRLQTALKANIVLGLNYEYCCLFSSV